MKYLILSIFIFLIAACDSKTSSSGSCGDNVIDVGEECDGVELGGETCETQGSWTGTLSCNSDCTFNTNLCSGSCGDGAIAPDSNEQCDGDNLGGATCESLNMGSGTLGCAANCTYDYSSCDHCGDGVVQTEAGEECDMGNLDGHSCHSQGYFGGTLSCDSSCKFVTTACTSLTTLSSGSNHSCGVTADRRAYCWGDGYRGQLGDRMATASDCVGEHCRTTPTPIPTDDIQDFLGFLYVGGAYEHSCAIAYGNDVYCWGDSNWAQTGVLPENAEVCGTSACQYMPFNATAGVATFVQTDSGGTRNTSVSCAVEDYEADNTMRQGRLYCWGSNISGQIPGAGDLCSGYACSHTPVEIMVPDSVYRVATGDEHTCALTHMGGIYCWGTAEHGEMGTGPGASSDCPELDPIVCHDAPTAVDLSGVISNSSFMELTTSTSHTCVRNNDGEAWCWGNNEYGQLGDGTYTSSDAPVKVDVSAVGEIRFKSISAGGGFTCGVDMDGGLWCWGSDSYGQIGNGETDGSEIPQPASLTGILADTAFTFVSAGQSHACALSEKGGVYCWGMGQYGATGLGHTTDVDIVSQVEPEE